MNMTVVIIGGIIAIALILGGAVLLKRAQSARRRIWPGVTVLAAGLMALVGTVIVTTITEDLRRVGSTNHEVEVVSRSPTSRRFSVTLRNLETGEIHENVALRSTRTGTTRRGRRRQARCADGPENLTPGRRFSAPFIVLESRSTGARSETLDASALRERFC